MEAIFLRGLRSPSEQLAGLGIIAIASLLFTAFNIWLHAGSWPIQWLNHGCLTLSFWSLWRFESMRKLRVEFILFLSLFLFEILWSLTLFQEPILALILVILWISDAILVSLLFWKKNKLSATFL